MAESRHIDLLVVTPALVADQYLVETIESVASCVPGSIDWRHVIVAPGAVGELLPEADNLVFMEEAEGTSGVFEAVSQGFALGLARFNPGWCTYINADDVLRPGFARMARAAVEHARAEVCYGNVEWLNRDGSPQGGVSIWPHASGLESLFLQGIPALTQQGTLFRSSAWRRAGGFAPGLRLTADSELWLRMLKLGFRFEHFDALVAGYRLRPGQLSGDQHRARAESRQWQEAHRLGSPREKIDGLFWRTAFRLRFVPRYLARLLRGRRLRTSTALQKAGF